MHLTMVFMSLMVFVATAACEYSTAMGNPSDYVYPYYALRYVSLGDYKQQSNQGAYNTADQQGYLRYVTYMTDGSNIYRTIIRMKPGSTPNPTWARLPAQSTSSQTNRGPTPTAAKLFSQDGRYEASQDSALAWAKLQVQDPSENLNQDPTTDSSNTPAKERNNQANLSPLEPSTAPPAQARSNDETEISVSFLEKSDDTDIYPAEVLPELPAQGILSQIDHESLKNSEKLQDRGTTDQASQEPQSKTQQGTANKEETNTSEDATPPTTTIKNTGSEEEKEEVSTLVPFPDELNIDNEDNAEMIGEESRETKLVADPQGKEELRGNDLTAEETFTPKYISTPYGPLAVYPLGYQPYATQRRQMMRPMTGSLKSQNLSVHSTSTTSTERNPTKTSTTVPTMVGSSSLSYPTGSPLQISYAYPYMRYNGQSAVMYQVPQQQYKTNQMAKQYLRWPGLSQSSYQPTYPQGYVSYQPSVMAVRSVPFTPTAGINVKQ